MATSSKSEAPQGANDGVIANGIKILGESFIAPGSSLLLDGKILPGAVHLAGGLLARWAIGPLGWFLVAANSYSRSVTNRGLLQTADQEIDKVRHERKDAATSN